MVSFVGIEYDEETTYKRYFDSELAKKIYCYLDNRIMELYFEDEKMNVDYGYSLLARCPKREWCEFQIETITPDLVAAFEVLLNEYDLELDDLWCTIIEEQYE